MNLRHLRTFVAIADAGGFARAAARLNLSQPAASRQILALEIELGIPLFDRVGQRIQLTSQGEDLLRRTRHLLSEAESLAERARALKGGQTGTLRMGATPQVIENLLAAFLTQYRERHKGVEVRLVEDGGARLPGRLERGDVHLAIMPAADDGVHGRLLYPMCLMALLPETHPLCRHALLDITALAEESLLLLAPGFATRTWFDAACQVADIRPRILLESAAPSALVALAGTGYGIAIVPSLVQIPRKSVHSVPLVYRGAAIGKWATVAWNPQRFQAPYAGLFVEELLSYCRRTYPGRELVRRAPPLPRPKEQTG